MEKVLAENIILSLSGRLANFKTQKPVHRVTDINIIDTAVLPSPELLLRQIRRSEAQAAFVVESRRRLHEIIFTEDRRFLMIVGPCSIHDLKAGREYAERLAVLSQRVKDRIELVMRVYFEKPRTSLGWKGLIMDPYLDGSCDIVEGLRLARQFLGEVINLGLPTATELLDPITPQYISDLVCWSAIGARTSESQTHRQMASGLSMPLGFKNSTSGNLLAAVNAIKAAGQPQTFLGISRQGLASAISTRGNPNCHIILRGGDNGPNYSHSHIQETKKLLEKNNLRQAIMIDCSHANCGKDFRRQPAVLESVLQTLLDGEVSIIGVMLESNLEEGHQVLGDLRELRYGLSITDPCLGWTTTEKLILETYEKLAPRFR